jgi:anthranilate synthase/aminodeoxychorismate synthase-like glutamine amidotransferase
MILVIDNHDSFVHNLARLLRVAGGQTQIFRNDEISVEECLALNPKAIVLSPGPGRPEKAGICIDLIIAAAHLPLLGVCLGSQAIIEAYGGQTLHAKEPLHGQARPVHHDGAGLFAGLPSPMLVGRYHSLIGVPQDKGDLQVQAWSDGGEVMAIAHRVRPHFGVQFHPESLLTEHGKGLLESFVKLSRDQEREG